MYIIIASCKTKKANLTRAFIRDNKRQAASLKKQLSEENDWFDIIVKKVDSVNYNFLTLKIN